MVKIMTSEIDASLTEDSRVIPGLGEFADHYLGEAVRIVNQHANRRFYICCNKEVELLPLRELPSPLKELLDAPMFRVLIHVANGMIAFTSSGAHVDHTITGKPGHSFTEYMVKTNTVSVHSCMLTKNHHSISSYIFLYCE
ncbi:hypothetical protein F2Q70_00010612 [Brassica cretica]|uniref:Uncharacterized protein n=1 Tax=Brassica cretica TaxID=69181 RepID=A0A8S9M9D1_BRACR|nr:hypothetical protein F2Q70_00010612 [Brassica cretica]